MYIKALGMPSGKAVFQMQYTGQDTIFPHFFSQSITAIRFTGEPGETCGSWNSWATLTTGAHQHPLNRALQNLRELLSLVIKG